MGINPDNMKVTSGRDSNYKSSDVKMRPSTAPKSHKDFKKVLEKGGEDAEDDENAAVKEIIEETDGIELAIEEETKKKPPLLCST